MGERTNWEPSEKQRALAKVFQDANYDIDVGDACLAADVGRSTYYQWHEIPEFTAWWREQAEHHFTLRLTRVLANLANGAEQTFAGGKVPDAKPDAGLIKTFLERFDKDYAPKERKELSGGLDVRSQVNLVWSDDAGGGNG